MTIKVKSAQLEEQSIQNLETDVLSTNATAKENDLEDFSVLVDVFIYRSINEHVHVHVHTHTHTSWRQGAENVVLGV